VGILPVLDTLIGFPLELALDGMALDQDISDAILAAPNDGGGMRPLLDFALCFEALDFAAASQLAQRLGVPIQNASALYLDAIDWADKIPRESLATSLRREQILSWKFASGGTPARRRR
jgi:hypothetical protein